MNRQWVIPDTHGCLKTLRKLIEDQIQPTVSDTIYLLGDYIDRGPESKGVLDYLMQWPADTATLSLLKGNHEVMLLKAYREPPPKKNWWGRFVQTDTVEMQWKQYGGDSTLRSFGVSSAKQIPEQYIDFMASLQPVVVLESYVLVHAGLDFNAPDPLAISEVMWWGNDSIPDRARIGGRIVIHGHTHLEFGMIEKLMKDPQSAVWPLDNGCVYKRIDGYGKLLALELTTLQLIWQKNIDTF
jgi:serine/threonine protein phosphatase 1